MKRIASFVGMVIAWIALVCLIFVLPIYLAVTGDANTYQVEDKEHDVAIKTGLAPRRYAKICINGATYLKFGDALSPLFDSESKIVKCVI